MDYRLMEVQLALHEGIRLSPYVDTEGHLTCLVGYNVDARGWDFVERTIGRKVIAPGGLTEKLRFTREEALQVLRGDIRRIEKAMFGGLFPEYAKLHPVHQRVVLDLGFNVGRNALGFKRAKAALLAGNRSACARELYASKWAFQVDDGPGGRFGRADRMAKMVLTAAEPDDLEWRQFLATYA